MNKLILAVLIAALFLVLPVQATIYVGGEDGVTTISEAIEAAKEDETIIVREGIYRENVDIDKPLILKAFGNVTIEAADDSNAVVDILASNVVFSGFNVKGGIIGIDCGNNNSILNNTICDNHIGIYISASRNKINNNIINKNLYNGIWIFNTYKCNNNLVINNTIYKNGFYGIYVERPKGFGDPFGENEINSNIVNENLYGIGLSISNNISILNNTIYENKDKGIDLKNSTNNLIKKNIVFENGNMGIHLEDSFENTVSNNIFNKNMDGIVLFKSNSNLITNNTAYENKIKGIILECSSKNIIDNNLIIENLFGIYSYKDNIGNVIMNNFAYNNQYYGFYLSGFSENKIKNNTISNNDIGIGLFHEGLFSISLNNKIINNNIASNEDQIDSNFGTDKYINIISYNYWSDYTGEDKDRDGIGDEPYYPFRFCNDSHPYMDYSGWLNVVITPEFWEFYTKKADIQYFYNNFSIENRLNSPTTVEVILEHNLEFVTDSERATTKTFSIDPKSTEDITLRLNVTNLEGYILRKITFKTEEYIKTTLVHGLVQPKINEVKIEGVDYHRNVVKGQINPFNVMLRNHGDRDLFSVTLTMGSKEKSKQVFLSDNKSVTKTVPFEIDTSDMPLGITRGQVAVLNKSNQLAEPPLVYLNLTMFVASELEASTLIVTNISRFNGSESEELRKELINLTHHPAVNGILLDVSCDYSEFDSKVSNYTKANELCEAIKQQIEEQMSEYPNVKYLIIVGDDRVIPFYRIEDGTAEVFTRETGLPDERKYFNSEVYPDPLSESIDEALSSNHFLTDDFYSRLEDEQVLAVGRLVEKPDEIIRAIKMFFDFYQLTPKSIFVTSCESPSLEFMYDGGEECYQEWCKSIDSDEDKRITSTFKYRYSKKGSNYAQPHEIIADIFNSSVAALFLHANYDWFEVPPCSGAGSMDYVEAEEIKTVNGSVIYSMGCHAGLTIPAVKDLPQSFLSSGTIVYIAPTSYGLGGLITVAGHERLLDYLTKRISGGEDVGFALINAKNDYYLDNFHQDTLDEKVLQSLTLYGFPMYTIRLDSSISSIEGNTDSISLTTEGEQKLPVAALSDSVGIEGHTIKELAYTPSNTTLEHITVKFRPINKVHVIDNVTTYYTCEGYTTEAGMPILPKATLDFICGEKEIRGMVLRSARFDVNTTRLTIESFAVSGAEGREYNFTGWYPSIPFILNTIEDRQSIVTASAQYKLIHKIKNKVWLGYVRLFNETVVDIFRVPRGVECKKPEVAEPTIDREKGVVTVAVNDSAGIYDVFITYLGPENTTWKSKTMDTRYRGKQRVEITVPLNSTAFFIQAIDVNGNVEAKIDGEEYYLSLAR